MVFGIVDVVIVNLAIPEGKTADVAGYLLRLGMLCFFIQGFSR